MKTSNFSKASFQELEDGLEKYIKLISEKGILEAESNLEKIKKDKQEIKQRLWKSPTVESEIDEKVFKVNKNSEIMQMVDQHNVNLLEPKKTVGIFSYLHQKDIHLILKKHGLIRILK